MLGLDRVAAWQYGLRKPWLELLASRSMGHPLELGPYRGLRPFGLAAGASRFRPGIDNPSTIEAESVAVAFDPLRSLLSRRWVLQIQIHRARVDLRRNSQGSLWQLGRVPPGGEPPPLTLRYGLSGGPAQVQLHGADGSKASLAMAGSLAVDLRGRRLESALQLRPAAGGQLAVDITNAWQRQQLRLQLQPQALKLASLLPWLPGALKADVSGALNGRLSLESSPTSDRCQGQIQLAQLRWRPSSKTDRLQSDRLDLRCSPQGLRLAASPLEWGGWRGRVQGAFPLVGPRANQLALKLQAREPKAGHRLRAELAGPLDQLQLELGGQWQGLALAEQPAEPLHVKAKALLRNQRGFTAALERLVLRQGGGELVARGALWPRLQLRSERIVLGARQRQVWGSALGSTETLQLQLQQLGDWSQPQLALDLQQADNPLLGSIRSRVTWRPSALRLESFDSPYLTAHGPLPLQGKPMRLAIDLQRYPLARLSPLVGPTLRGALSAAGTIEGPWQQLRPDLRLQADAPGVGLIGLEERWVGQLQAEAKGGARLRLVVPETTVPGLLEAQLDSRWQPTRVSLKRAGGELALSGAKQRYRWRANRFPLSGFDLALWRSAAPQPLSGYLSGQGALALNPFALEGELRVEQPQLFGLYGRSLQAKADFSQRRSRLDGEWQALGSGSVGIQLKAQQDGPLWLRLEARQLQSQTLQELLAAVPKWGGLGMAPSGRAFDLGTLVFNTQGFSLSDQLLALAQAQRQRQQAVSNQREVELQDLRGVLDADFTLRGPSADQLFVDLAAQGHLWLQGTDRDLALTDQPTVVRLQGPLNQGGDFELAHLPLALLALVAPVPDGLRGSLSSRGSYRFGGRDQTPSFALNLSLQDGSLNGERLSLERGELKLQDNRLAIDWVLRGGDASEAVSLRGEVPLDVASEGLELRIGSRGDGLRFLTALSGSAVRWKEGSADLELLIRGSLLKPVANGFLRFSNGVMQLADQTVRDLDAVVLFDFSSLEMQTLSARVGDKGSLNGSGDLNLFSPGEKRLKFTVKRAPFKLSRMAAVADGTVEIGGSLFRPVLGGELALSHGAINVQPGELATEDAPNKPTSLPALLESKWDFSKPLLVMGRQLESSSSQDLRAALPDWSSVRFERFRVRFGRDFRVEVPNVLNFGAGGQLTLNGPLDPDIQISGVVRLLRGRLGLFTTTFSLDPDAPNVAVFTPSLGLIPYLDIVLRTRVSDTLSALGNGNRSSIYDWNTYGSFNNSSLTPNSFDQLQLVRVRLEVTGPADQLMDNIRLSSTPPLPQDRLLALIGGNSLVGLAEGNAGAAVATVVGQSLLSPLVGSLTELLGQRLTFAIYPAYVLPTNYDAESNRSGQVPSQLVPVTDIGLDVSERFNASVLAAPNRSDIPPQLTLGYQAKPWLGLQTSIDAESRWQTQMQVFFRF